MALPTKEELTILHQFQNRVSDVLSKEQLSDDIFLLRWLRARELDLEQAESMLRKAIQWRKDNNVDSIITGQSVSDYFYKTFVYWLDGVDREGRPVFSVPFGKWDIRKIVNDGKSEEFITYVTEGFENILRAIRVSSKLYPPKPGCAPVSQITAIFDWSGVAWSQLLYMEAIQNFLQMGLMYESYYPEIVHKIYFINCPALISAALTLLKSVLAPKTLAKIQCFNTDKNVWKQEFLKYIDEDQLRPQFGGTKQD